jgi:hypothetical protein
MQPAVSKGEVVLYRPPACDRRSNQGDPMSFSTRLLRLVGAASLAIGLAACASGPQRGGPGGPGGRAEPAAETVAPDALILLEFDTNHDRTVSSEELRAGIAADWAQVAKAAPAIGHIALREWLVSVLGSDEFDFGPVGFDTNFDGAVTQNEFTAALTQRFTVLDANKDGNVTRAELVRHSLGRTGMPMRGAGGQTPGPGGSQGGSPPRRGGPGGQ